MYTVNSAPSDPIETNFDIELKEDYRLRLTQEESPISARLSGPQEPPSNHNASWPSPKSDKVKECLITKTQMDMNRPSYLTINTVDWMFQS